MADELEVGGEEVAEGFLLGGAEEREKGVAAGEGADEAGAGEVEGAGEKAFVERERAFPHRLAEGFAEAGQGSVFVAADKDGAFAGGDTAELQANRGQSLQHARGDFRAAGDLRRVGLVALPGGNEAERADVKCVRRIVVLLRLNRPHSLLKSPNPLRGGAPGLVLGANRQRDSEAQILG